MAASMRRRSKEKSSKMARALENDLTQGNVAKQLIRFSVPFIISSLIQNLYSMADLIIVGQFAGTVSLAGVNVSATLMSFITSCAVGFCVGGSVCIGQHIGAGRLERAKATIGNICFVLFIAAVVFTALVLILLTPLMRLIQTPAEAWSETRNYLVICSIGTVFIFSYNALSAIFRGMGDSKRPFYIVLAACLLNVALDLLMVGALKLGAGGAALATIISQGASVIGCIIIVKRGDFIFDFKLKSFAPDRESLREILRLSLPTTAQNAVQSVSFVFLTALASSLGTTAVAATGSMGKLIDLGIRPSIAIGNSVSAMCAQNFGAGEEERAVKTMKVSIVMNFILNAALFIFLQAAAPILPFLYERNDPAFAAECVRYLRSFAFDVLFVPFMGNICGFCIGAGHSMFASVLNMCSSVIVRVPVSFVFGLAFNMGVFGIGLGATVASVISSIVAIIYYLSKRWRRGLERLTAHETQ